MQEQNNILQDQSNLQQQQQQPITQDQSNNINNQSIQIQQEQIQQNNNQEKILDFWDFIIQGNFDILFLYTNVIDINKLGPQGFGIVHYLATYGQLEGLKYIKKYGANLDLQSSGQQTALSIACNYGFIEVSKFLIDNNCNINHINSVGMTPLGYAIKNKKYPLIFYLMIKINNLNYSDNQGNSFLHYSAQENDIFMFRFYKAYEIQTNLFDKQGQTPLTKAVNNCSINVIKFMLKNNPEFINYALDFNVINSSLKIQQLITKAKISLKFSQIQKFQQIKQIFIKYSKSIKIIFMILILFFQLIFFAISEVQKTLNDGYFGLIIDISFIIGLLYMIFFIVWFMTKTTDNQNQGIKLLQRKINQLNQKKQESDETYLQIQQSEDDITQNQKKERKNQRKNLIQQKSNQNQNDEMLPLNMNGNKEQELTNLNQDELQDQNQQEEDEEDENEDLIKQAQNKKANFFDKMREENKKRISFYDIDMTPSYLEGITLKDFLSINYKEVEDFVDQMKNKPNYYFKFATRISQYKEEINQLLEINDPLWYSGFTIFHIIYFLFEQNRLNLIHRINWDRICFTCLSYKLPRTSHCSKCDECVKDFHFHSNILGKCINSTNHLFYFIFILSLAILVNSYLLFIFLHYYDKINSIFVLIPNLFFLIDQNSRIQALLFIFNFWISFILNFELIVEILCIVYNMTQNEFFNGPRYKYLYQVIKLKNDKYYMTYISRLKNGIGMNIFHFIRNSFRNLKLL